MKERIRGTEQRHMKENKQKINTHDRNGPIVGHDSLIPKLLESKKKKGFRDISTPHLSNVGYLDLMSR